MPAVNKSAFLRPLRQRTECYPLPEYGDDCYVIIQALTSRDMVALQTTYGGSPSSANMRFVHDLFARTLVDDDGKPVFENPEDAEAHFNLSIPAMESLVETCLRVSGIDTKRVDDAKN